jgi:hypothetical protein
MIETSFQQRQVRKHRRDVVVHRTCHDGNHHAKPNAVEYFGALESIVIIRDAGRCIGPEHFVLNARAVARVAFSQLQGFGLHPGSAVIESKWHGFAHAD